MAIRIERNERVTEIKIGRALRDFQAARPPFRMGLLHGFVVGDD
jgi:hypothetical protein